MTRVTILNSHQSKTPLGSDPWVIGIHAAVAYAARCGWTVVSSIGLNTWELVTWATARQHGDLEIVLPGTENPDAAMTAVADSFGIHISRVHWHFLDGQVSRRSPKSWWTSRDEQIVGMADILLPISIRPGGQIDSLIGCAPAGKIIDDRFRIAHDPQPHHERSAVDSDRIDPVLREWGADFLIHWTRACHGPWPGERAVDYYADLVTSRDSYCRSAFATLQRIMREGTLRASAWRIGARKAMVAFTGLSPAQSLPLMSWRPRWSRWSFEPYGVAVRRDWAEAHGVRSVRYVTEEEWSQLHSDDRPFCHRRGRRADIWPAEHEWRHDGDFRLDGIPSRDIRIIVRRECEATLMRERVPVQVYAFEHG